MKRLLMWLLEKAVGPVVRNHTSGEHSDVRGSGIKPYDPDAEAMARAQKKRDDRAERRRRIERRGKEDESV